MSGKTINVAILEDNPAQSAALRANIASIENFQVLWSTSSISGARALLAHMPDVLLCDLELIDGLSFDLISEVSHQTYVIVITVFGDEASTVKAIESGAAGYLLKGSSELNIESNVNAILRGESPISAAIAGHLLKKFRKPQGSNPLTPREVEVLEGLARGQRYKEVATNLGCSYHTVAQHVRNIYEKLAVSSKSEAVFEATRAGIISINQ